MTDRCAPPDGTPAGTVCVLSCEMEWYWVNGEWSATKTSHPAFGHSPEDMRVDGWRFVRVAGDEQRGRWALTEKGHSGGPNQN